MRMSRWHDVSNSGRAAYASELLATEAAGLSEVRPRERRQDEAVQEKGVVPVKERHVRM